MDNERVLSNQPIGSSVATSTSSESSVKPPFSGKVHLGDVCRIVHGKNQKAVENPGGLYPIYGSGGPMGRADEYICPANTTIIGRKGTINKPIYVNEPFWNVDTAFGLVANQNYLLPKYLFYFCAHFNFETLSTTSAIPSLTSSNIGRIQFTLPNLQYQLNCIEKLDSCTSNIDLCEATISKLDLLVKSRFNEMFLNQSYPSKPLSFFVESHIETAKRSFAPDDAIQYVDISSIDNSSQQIVRTTPYRFGDAPSRAQQHIQENDLLISTVRPNLKNIAINRIDAANLVASSGFCVLRSKGIPIEYLSTIVASDEFTTAMCKKTTGANYPAIKDSDILSYEVPDAPHEQIEEFANFVSQVDKLRFVTTPMCTVGLARMGLGSAGSQSDTNRMGAV